MRILLAGNPNCGKSTLFNKLTGGNQTVGNIAGLTVEEKSGVLKTDKDITLVDIPGIYSLDGARNEEVYAKNTIEAGCDGIINIVDATKLERSLFLTIGVLSLGRPTVIALNMRDELNKSGANIDTDKLSSLLGAPVVSISALKDKNFDELISGFKSPRKHLPFPKDAESIYIKIAGIVKSTLKTGKKGGEKLDKILLNKYLAFPIFFAVIFLVYFIAIQICGRVFGEFSESLMEKLSGTVEKSLTAKNCNIHIISLLCDGVILGAGEVLKFLPQLIAMFILMAVLEDCGYIPRIAVICDRIFDRLGMSGKTAVCMVLGCGCTVPAILSTRTIDEKEEREKSIFLLPFIPCNAKLPLFSLICGTIFPSNPFIAPLTYFVGTVGIVVGSCIYDLFKKAFRGAKTTQKESETMQIIELPPMRLPSINNVFRSCISHLKSFLIKTGTVVFSVSIVVWAAVNLSFSLRFTDIEHSILGMIGKFLSPIFYPIGFTDWRLNVALLAGIFGKENILSTLSILSGGEVSSLFTVKTALCYMLFILLSSPCIAALSAIKKELGDNKKFIKCLLFQQGAAYISCALISALGYFTLLAPAFIILYTVIEKRIGGADNVIGYRDCKKRKNDGDRKLSKKPRAVKRRVRLFRTFQSKG